MSKNIFCRIVGTALLAVVATVAVSAVAPAAKADTGTISSCVTRSLSDTYTGTTWSSRTVCNAGEVAISAGGFCSNAGEMKGVSTTTGTADRLVWLWCSASGQAYWYAMCCG